MPTESAGPNPAYTQALQGVVNLASSPTLYTTASTTSAPTFCTQSIHTESQDSFLIPTPSISLPGILTAALERGAAAREAARISREKTVLYVAKALDTILPYFKKNCPGSAEQFEKKSLSAIEDLGVARPLNITQLISESQQTPELTTKSLPSKQNSKITYAEILQRGSNSKQKAKTRNT